MKDFLLSLINEYKEKYSDLIFHVEKSHVSKQWGMGLMPSYNPAPYICELQGSSPGRLLKNSSKPANNKQCYFLDNHQEIIAEIQYAKHIKLKEQWIIYRRFFLYKRLIEFMRELQQRPVSAHGAGEHPHRLHQHPDQ